MAGAWPAWRAGGRKRMTKSLNASVRRGFHAWPPPLGRNGVNSWYWATHRPAHQRAGWLAGNSMPVPGSSRPDFSRGRTVLPVPMPKLLHPRPPGPAMLNLTYSRERRAGSGPR